MIREHQKQGSASPAPPGQAIAINTNAIRIYREMNAIRGDKLRADKAAYCLPPPAKAYSGILRLILFNIIGLIKSIGGVQFIFPGKFQLGPALGINNPHQLKPGNFHIFCIAAHFL